MVFRSHRRTGTAIGAAMSVLAVLAALLLAVRVATQPLSFTSFLAGVFALCLLAAGATLGYWAWGCWSLRYRLTRNALIIEWAGNQERVPLADITQLVLGRSLPAPDTLAGVGWPGYRVGRATVQGLPVLLLAAFDQPDQLTYVHTPRAVYGVAPEDPDRFEAEVKQRQAAGPSTQEVHRARRWLPWRLSIWHDQWAVGLLLAAAVINLLLFAYQAFLMPAVPPETALHFSPLGFVDRAGPRAELLLLPLTGLLVLLVNGGLSLALHTTERFGAYLALSSGLLAQALLFAATVRLLT